MFMRVIAKTTTGDQFRVGRELRRRISDALEEAGISQHLAASQLMMRTMGAQAGGAGGSAPGGGGGGAGGGGSPGGRA
jgi:hypothetical protein